MKTFSSFYGRKGSHTSSHPSNLTTFNIDQFAYMVKKMATLKKSIGTLLDNYFMIWNSGLENGNKHHRENLPFIIDGKGSDSVNTCKFRPGIKGNQGDLLTTLVACAGLPLNSPIGIATKQITEIKI